MYTYQDKIMSNQIKNTIRDSEVHVLLFRIETLFILIPLGLLSYFRS